MWEGLSFCWCLKYLFLGALLFFWSPCLHCRQHLLRHEQPQSEVWAQRHVSVRLVSVDQLVEFVLDCFVDFILCLHLVVQVGRPHSTVQLFCCLCVLCFLDSVNCWAWVQIAFPASSSLQIEATCAAMVCEFEFEATNPASLIWFRLLIRIAVLHGPISSY